MNQLGKNVEYNIRRFLVGSQYVSMLEFLKTKISLRPRALIWEIVESGIHSSVWSCVMDSIKNELGADGE
jgi:hypothetical protein